MASVLLDQVIKTYPGGFTAVKGVSFAVPDGGFCVLVGPSGCGKSTLLRMIAGLETISDGAISIGNRVVNQIEPMDRDIAMVFQNYALYPHMSVYNNMAYGLRNRGMDEAGIKTRVNEAAQILEIGQLLDPFGNSRTSPSQVRFQQPHILGRCEMGKEPAVLQHKTDTLTNCRQTLGYEPLVVKEDFAGVRLDETDDHPQQRTLAATAWPQQHGGFAFRNGQGRRLQHSRAAERFLDLNNPQHASYPKFGWKYRQSRFLNVDRLSNEAGDFTADIRVPYARGPHESPLPAGEH